MHTVPWPAPAWRLLRRAPGAFRAVSLPSLARTLLQPAARQERDYWSGHDAQRHAESLLETQRLDHS